MDPIENLREQRELAASLKAREAAVEDLECYVDDALRLADLVEALDQWRLSGGFDPYAKAERVAAP